MQTFSRRKEETWSQGIRKTDSITSLSQSSSETMQAAESRGNK